jgi:hypothetical protein
MKLYKIVGDTPGGVTEVLMFCGTQADVKRGMKHYARNPSVFRNVYWEEEEIPTNKPGLLKWLNDWCLHSEVW